MQINRARHDDVRTVGAVVIGRNEGERLRSCLSALCHADLPTVYVDSGSVDGSRELAVSLGVVVVELDTSIAFTAARARNAGFNRLIDLYANLQFVQFVDGDCEVVKGWFDAAVRRMLREDSVDAVCGRRRERYPRESIYNRMIDIEWDTPCGRARAFGGDAMVRVDAFEALGGFDVSVAAGEEPEFCNRLSKRGGKIERIDAEMTLHDASVHRLAQWWKRNVRSGYGGLDVRIRKGVRLFDQELRSARRWTVGWLLLTLGESCLLGWFFGGVGLVAGVMVGILVWMLQTARVTRSFANRGFSTSDAFKAGAITMLMKWPNLLGQIRFWFDSRSGRVARLIEYKSEPTAATIRGATR